MGVSMAWTAVRNASPAAIHALAQVDATEEPDEYFEGHVSGGYLRSGWYLLVAGSCDHRFGSEILLSKFSQQWDCVSVRIEEHVMYSAAAYWTHGRAIWSVTHDSQKGIDDLTGAGSLPDSYATIAAEKRALQDRAQGDEIGVDHIFEIPLLLASNLCGFKHDEDDNYFEEGSPVALVDLRPASRRSSRPWWRIW